MAVELKLAGLVACLIVLGGSLYLTVYSLSNDFQLCEKIRNCTVNVVEKYPADDLCYYQLVVNGKYHCDYRWCTCSGNNSGTEICPANGSKCHISKKELEFCYQHGFAPLYACRSRNRRPTR